MPNAAASLTQSDLAAYVRCMPGLSMQGTQHRSHFFGGTATEHTSLKIADAGLLQWHLKQLAQRGDNAVADERVDVDAGRPHAGRVGAARAVDPLHDQHPRRAQVPSHLRSTGNPPSMEEPEPGSKACETSKMTCKPCQHVSLHTWHPSPHALQPDLRRAHPGDLDGLVRFEVVVEVLRGRQSPSLPSRATTETGESQRKAGGTVKPGVCTQC